MKVKLVDSATLLADGNSKNFEMISYQWSGRPDPDGNTYQFFKTTPGHLAELVGHLESADRRAAGQDARGPEPGRAQEALQRADADAARTSCRWSSSSIPIEPKAFSPRVQGYEPIPDGMMRFKDVWLK